MGLFDIVHSKKPMPDGYKPRELQTKDFENPYMEHYTIEDDGRLYKEKPWHVEDGQRIDMDFHGWLRLHGGGAHVYAAKFTDGQLVEIKLIPEEDQ